MSDPDGSFHLLYVDADATYGQEVAAAFEPTWTVTAVKTAKAAVEVVDSSVDCVVSADALPDRHGIELFKSMCEEPVDIPFVLFVETADTTLLREAFRADVADVIYKERSDSTDPVSTDPASHDAVAPCADVDRGSEGTETRVGTRTGTWTETQTRTQSTSAGGVRRQLPTAWCAPGSTDGRSRHGDSGTEIPDGILGLRHCLTDLVGKPKGDLAGITLDVSRSLMGAAIDEVDMKIEWALQSLATEIGATRCLIYRYDADAAAMRLTHGWSETSEADGGPECLHDEIHDVGADCLSIDEFPGFHSRLQQFSSVCYDETAGDTVGTASNTVGTANDTVGTANVEDEQTSFDADRGTLLALPIVVEWQLAGAIVLTTDVPRTWPESSRQRLQAVGELIGHMERRRRRRRELERQNEQLEQFASVISHDLQNPLNVISGYLDLTIETGDLDRLSPAISAADRMEALLADLLTLAREGRAVGDKERVEARELVTEAWNTVDTREATLETEGLDSLDPLLADPTRLTEALENLFRNAIVHVGPNVTIRVEATDGGLAIADDGPGIPPEERSTIFEHGYTGGDGTGLGLAIVRTIVEAHGWTIDVAESADGGARFEIDFNR